MESNNKILFWEYNFIQYYSHWTTENKTLKRKISVNIFANLNKSIQHGIKKIKSLSIYCSWLVEILLDIYIFQGSF